MSYEVLARKWRPGGFDEVTGQAHVTTPLRNAIRSERVPHAILLTGPRGVGKTTLARILARCLNCEKGPTDAPCGACPACREIAEGRSTDVQEIDAASRTSVDDVREIIESVRYAPSPGKHRIYVVDEVHMLSQAAFNALLKTLEEPPPRSLFVFATTNPEKIPYTVVSRCQRFDLRRIATPEIVARLREVASSEGAKLSDASLGAMARAGEGSLRDALTLLDQVLAAGSGRIDDARVAEVLDLVDRRLLLALAAACIDGQPAAALEAAQRADESGVEPGRLAGELLRTLRDLVVLRVAPDAPGLVDAADADLAALRELAERADPDRLRRMFRALVRELEDLAFAPEPTAVLEMALVRLATLPDGGDVAQLVTRLEALERRLGGAPESGTRSGGGSGGAAGAPRGGKRGAGSRGGRPPRREATPAEPAPAPVVAEPAQAGPAPRTTDAAAPGRDAPLGEVYERLRAFAQQRNRGLFAALEGGELRAREGDALHLVLPDGIASRRLEGRLADLEAVCERFFGEPTRVRLERRGSGAEPERDAAADAEALRRRRHEALDHPAVNAALEILEGEILEIRPLGDTR